MTGCAAELEAAITRDPDDPEPYLVYADWLQSTGDPRGLLIVLQHHGRWAEADALIEEHREHVLGPLASFPLDGSDPRELELKWYLGFFREAQVGWRIDSRR